MSTYILSLVVKLQLAVFCCDEDGALCGDASAEDGAAEIVEEQGLESALDGTCTVFGVISFLGDEADGIVVDVERDALVLETMGDAAELDLHNLLDLVLLQRLEHQDVVDTVHELRTQAEFDEAIGQFFTSCSGYGPSP